MIPPLSHPSSRLLQRSSPAPPQRRQDRKLPRLPRMGMVPIPKLRLNRPRLRLRVLRPQLLRRSLLLSRLTARRSIPRPLRPRLPKTRPPTRPRPLHDPPSLDLKARQVQPRPLNTMSSRNSRILRPNNDRMRKRLEPTKPRRTRRSS